MRAVVQDSYGPVDDLEFKELDPPAIGEADVLVRVRAAGVDLGIWHQITGLPYLMRLMGFGFRRPRNRVPGFDVAGVVEAVGSRVTRFQPGDEVFGTCSGAFAEFARAAEDELFAKPACLDFEQAAVVPGSAYTALVAVRAVGSPGQGKRVLVIGAAGGVGLYTVQLAKHLGAEVTGVCSTKQMEFVTSLGADHVIDYTREEFTDGSRQWDVILDLAGRRPLSRLRRALTTRGVLAIVGGEGGGRFLGGVERQLGAALWSPFTKKKMRTVFAMEPKEGMAELIELLEAGSLRPVIDRRFPLEQGAEALRHLGERRVGGKAVVVVGS